MTPPTFRYNWPPNWPPPPAGWSPQPGWLPDPAWGPPPPGWQLWVPDVPIEADTSDAPLPGSWISRNTTLTVAAYVTVVLLAVVGAVIHAVGGDDPDDSAVAAPVEQPTTTATEPAPEPDPTPAPEPTKTPKVDDNDADAAAVAACGTFAEAASAWNGSIYKLPMEQQVTVAHDVVVEARHSDTWNIYEGAQAMKRSAATNEDAWRMGADWFYGACLEAHWQRAPAPEPEPEPEKGGAIRAGLMCEDWVEERLVSPSTADFDWSNYDVSLLGPSRYQVLGTVDSENKHGAMVPSDFSCKVEDNGDDTWTLKALRVTK